MAAVNKKIRNLQKKRKNIGKTSTPNEIVKEIKRWWKSRDRPGSLTSFFQNKDKFITFRIVDIFPEQKPREDSSYDLGGEQRSQRPAV